MWLRGVFLGDKLRPIPKIWFHWPQNVFGNPNNALTVWLEPLTASVRHVWRGISRNRKENYGDGRNANESLKPKIVVWFLLRKAAVFTAATLRFPHRFTPCMFGADFRKPEVELWQRYWNREPVAGDYVFFVAKTRHYTLFWKPRGSFVHVWCRFSRYRKYKYGFGCILSEMLYPEIRVSEC